LRRWAQQPPMQANLSHLMQTFVGADKRI
jgi:hypothetical protein